MEAVTARESCIYVNLKISELLQIVGFLPVSQKVTPQYPFVILLAHWNHRLSIVSQAFALSHQTSDISKSDYKNYLFHLVLAFGNYFFIGASESERTCCLCQPWP